MENKDEKQSHVKGEVAGSYLLGLSQSFANLNIIPQNGLNLQIGKIDPVAWYPYSMLTETLKSIESSFSSHKSIFFQAGIHFLRIWYEDGPGKTMIFSGLDWLYANSESQGYNTVVRGSSLDDIGWCLLKSIDEEAGIATYENVMALSPELVRGIFYGGCMIFDDFEYFNVEVEEEEYPQNPTFYKFTLTVLFRLKSKKQDQDLYQKIKYLPHGSTLELNAAEIEALIWAYKHVITKQEHDSAYSQDINYILSDAVKITQQTALELEQAKLMAEKANLEISRQKEELNEKQREILDSINYAQKIQTALLANEHALLGKNFDYFVLLKPKDIVSGDFIWTVQKRNLFYLACCDSTGHGVPGAFMSLLNIGFLSEAISDANITRPGEVLNYVRQRLTNTIGKDKNQRDGFDGILLCINLETKLLSYAAANNQGILVRDNELLHLQYNKMPVGDGLKDDSFETYSLSYEKNDKLYLFTDGYADQFGGPKGKKFKYNQLEELILSNSSKPLKEQSDILNKTINTWRGNLEQVDDICVMGVVL